MAVAQETQAPQATQDQAQGYGSSVSDEASNYLQNNSQQASQEQSHENSKDQSQQSQQGQEPKTVVERKEKFADAKKAWISFYKSHRNQVFYGGIGVAIALSLIILGFWATLLLGIFVIAGVLYGRYKDGDVRFMATIQNLIDRLA